jgi:hypothetical protein
MPMRTIKNPVLALTNIDNATKGINKRNHLFLLSFNNPSDSKNP